MTTQTTGYSNAPLASRKKPIVIATTGLAVSMLLLLLAFFVWPTLYRYEEAPFGRIRLLVRINRITGDTERLTLSGWSKMFESQSSSNNHVPTTSNTGWEPIPSTSVSSTGPNQGGGRFDLRPDTSTSVATSGPNQEFTPDPPSKALPNSTFRDDEYGFRPDKIYPSTASERAYKDAFESGVIVQLSLDVNQSELRTLDPNKAKKLSLKSWKEWMIRDQDDLRKEIELRERAKQFLEQKAERGIR